MFDTFKARAEAVSATVQRFAHRPEALSHILGLLAGEGVTSAPGAHAVWARGRFLEGLDLGAIGPMSGVRFDVTRELAASARVGVSQADLAIADTGTLAFIATDVEQRLVSSLPMVHIAIAATHAMVPDLATFLETLSPKDHAYLSLVTGPSRTADIERVLTIGVHGPERLIIVFIDDL